MRFVNLGQVLRAADPGVDRRGFLKATALAGGGMTLGWFPALGDAADAANAAQKKPANPSAFIKINPDNTVEILSNRLEFGQGTQTALPMLIAEELDVSMARVKGALAPAGEPYKDPLFGIQMTGGSTAVAHSWQQYREIGATARAMLVQAAASQWKVPVSDVRTADGFCVAGDRRASYASLAAAAAKLPVPEKVALKDPKDYKVIGKPTPRLDARAASTGQKRFGIDAKVKGQVVALIAHPPTFSGGKVAKLDASKALAVKGVRAVLEVPTDRGGTGVAVFADGYWQAKQGRDALAVEWTPGKSAGLSSAKLVAEFKEMAKSPKLVAVDWQGGASRDRFEQAAKKIVAEYEFPFLAHAPLEPLNCIVDARKDRCTVWAGSQFQTIDQAAIAQVLGLKPEQVTLFTMPAGGGFGRRAVPSSDYIREAAAVAKVWQEKGKGGPVKVMWSREDDIKGGYYRPLHVHRVEVGLDASGNIAAWDHAIVGQSILGGTPFEQFLVKNGVDHTMTEGVQENHYGLPMRLRVTHPDVPVPILWYRSVGNTHTAYVMETLIDEAARAAGKDPVAYRLALFGDRKPRHTAALRLAVEKSGYGTRQLPAGRAWGVAVHEGFNSVVANVVEVSLKDGMPVVHKVTAGVHCNRVVNPMTAAAQIEGGTVFGLSMLMPNNAITLKDGMVEQSQFTDYAPIRMADSPVVEAHFVPSDEPPTGLGEPGAMVVCPAVANGVAVLTGKRIRKLPFDPAELKG
jgi:isoquinoline 1-oxidoreductase beta subunit